MSQTTPYIGHPAYKAMGGRAAYTLATGLVVGLGGIFGYVAFVADVLPQAGARADSRVHRARDHGAELSSRHRGAMRRRSTIAVMPSVAQLVAIFLSQIQNGALMTAALDPELDGAHVGDSESRRSSARAA